MGGLVRIAVLRRLALAITRQHIQSDERVEQVGDAARMEAELVLKLARRQRLVTQGGEHAQLDG